MAGQKEKESDLMKNERKNQEDQKQQERNTKLSEKVHIVEFGRYEGNRGAESPHNEVFVGREKQRSQLLQLLFNRGKSGVYLITGYRGSGKTSFVQYCVGEFKNNVYERFLRTSVGVA